jgi:hypothetical protein
MRKKKLSAIALALVIVVGVIGPYIIPQVDALSWSNWTSAAVGDVSENSLPTYWSIVSTPYSGYESYLWSDWHTVISSEQNKYGDSNDNKEIVFSTYSSSSIMGIIDFTSKAEIEDTEEIAFRGRFGCRYSYNQVRTVGYVRIIDTTTQTTILSKSIESSGVNDQWSWQTFSLSSSSLDPSHDYVIKLTANDAWIQQKVEVAFESADVWAHSPYWRRIVEQGHSWRYIPRGYYYLCTILSDFYFKATPIADLNRDHRPYVTEGLIIGDPYGWDPCYLHEFRSYLAGTYEGDDWYATDMPGSVGYTDSTEAEELLDGFEEVEVYTRNPELFTANVVYYVQVRYQVWNTGWVDVVLEAELGNEDDYMAGLSPPAFPVAYMNLEEESFYHTSKSFYWYPSFALAEEDNPSITTVVPINIIDSHQRYDVIMKGLYPYYLKVFTKIDVEDKEGLLELKSSLNSNIDSLLNTVSEDTEVRASLTFDRLATVENILRLVDSYDLEVDNFRFTAQNGVHILRGQGTPNGEDIIPMNELNDFIPKYDLLGIQSLDVRVKARFLESLESDELIDALDISAFLSVINAGIDLDSFQEVHWYSEDASWYISYYG